MFFFLSFGWWRDDDYTASLCSCASLFCWKICFNHHRWIVCDAVFQAGERACKSNNEKLKKFRKNIFYSDCIIKNIFCSKESHIQELYNDCCVSQSLPIKTKIGLFLFIFISWSSLLWKSSTKQKILRIKQNMRKNAKMTKGDDWINLKAKPTNRLWKRNSANIEDISAFSNIHKRSFLHHLP